MSWDASYCRRLRPVFAHRHCQTNNQPLVGPTGSLPLLQASLYQKVPEENSVSSGSHFSATLSHPPSFMPLLGVPLHWAASGNCPLHGHSCLLSHRQLQELGVRRKPCFVGLGLGCLHPARRHHPRAAHGVQTRFPWCVYATGQHGLSSYRVRGPRRGAIGGPA